ncbi:MAG: ferritin family protein [Xanthobacteraceae bacterium]
MNTSNRDTAPRPGEPADGPPINSLADLLAVAWQIEADAVERYHMLADQMETFNNRELTDIFRDLARAEGIHRDEIMRMAGDIDVVAHARQLPDWGKGESPEKADLGDAHYLMTPWHALRMALAGEERAHAYFQYVLATTDDPKVHEMAKEFAEEEAEHVALCHRLLKRYPEPQGDAWAEDPDPPAPLE